MSIYIKGMEIPKSCYGNCPFFTQILPGEDHGLVNYCCLENWKQSRTPMPFSVEEAKRGRQNFCPLVPVPEHGDLIERDKLREIMFIGEQCLYSWDEIEDAIDYALTIIPASKEGEVHE